MKLAISGGEKMFDKPLVDWPIWDQKEQDGLLRVLKSGKWGSLHGEEVYEFENEFASFQDAEYAIAANSGTTALETALRALGIQAGDEVILPAYTFVATATAILINGAVPVFVDIDPQTYNIDPTLLEQAITEKTRAIMPVHFAGRPVDLDAISQIASKKGLFVIEDAAQAWGSEWRGRKVGATSNFGCFSFQSSKNINSAEGGIILTDDEEHATLARSYMNCGRVEGGVWYEHYHLGSNLRMTEFQGAILRAQLSRYREQLERRQHAASLLDKRLADLPGFKTLQSDVRITGQSRHLYIFRYISEAFDEISKGEFIKALQAEGVPCSGGYSIPLYEQPIFKNKSFGPFTHLIQDAMDVEEMHLANTHKACYEEALWLPQAVLLNDDKTIDRICDAIIKIYENRNELY
ncbi:MAG: DegT/DnrJ/EryC1/StrS family aminotransferase [Deferribacteres bacterium]|nr:DegT/DnrJ/EryC1/StrS family aminotransferase [candidate division KSB1 bacterium]MCB9503689.1 DegT/DnrJ/EryC1/StrS family aminotransferase [Deferribacteres bacterium]